MLGASVYGPSLQERSALSQAVGRFVALRRGGRDRRALRAVQAKSTANRQPNVGYVYGVHPSPNNELYKRGDFDSWQLA
jgi:hypothetical protein